MALNESYATKSDLSEYLFIDEEELPKDAERWLSRASDLIKQAMLNNFNSSNTSHVKAVTQAVCAQVEYWISAGEDKSIIGSIKSYSLDDLSITFDEKSSTGYLCIRAIGYLNEQGLLYRGVI